MEQKPVKPLITWVIIALSLIITIIALYVLFTFNNTNPRNNKAENQIQIGGDFKLTDQNGNIFNSDQLKGKLSLIYFGFTYCPDVCPASLEKITAVLETLDKYNINVNTVFITIDPARDSGTILKEYLSHFHPKIIGLTGSEEEVKDAADKFKVYYAKAPSASASLNNYMMDHSTFSYLMDSKGQYLKHFDITAKPEEIVEFIRINKSK